MDREAELRATPFATFERARDIRAITVNRWAHGYAYTDAAIDQAHRTVGEVLA